MNGHPAGSMRIPRILSARARYLATRNGRGRDGKGPAFAEPFSAGVAADANLWAPSGRAVTTQDPLHLILQMELLFLQLDFFEPF